LSDSYYVVELTGEAADEVEQAVKASGASPAAIVSDALAARRWVRENAAAGKLYIKDGHRYREVQPGQ